MSAVYLDNNATTRVDAEVLDAMLPWFRERYGNPSSMHGLGAEAARALSEAREQVAAAVGGVPERIVFTSGGTEANNLAVLGAARALRRRGDHVVTTTVEHPCVAKSVAALEEEGVKVTRVPVTASGELDADAVVDAVRDETILVSVMHVQNETGAIFPVEAIARRAKAKNRRLLVHVDGVQALGKLPAPADEAVDLYAISGHKVHGPKGSGALRLGPKARVLPLLHGGDQEGGLRSGTEALPNLVGLGVAATLAHAARRTFHQQAAELNLRARAGFEAVGGVINSPLGAAPSTINVSFPGVAAEPLLHALEALDVYVSAGAACASHKRQRSPVLLAMGLSVARIDSALRFSFSRETRAAELERALEALATALSELRASVAG